jgi:hypothetical protein
MPTFDSITQIADNIFEELGRPTDITISSIAAWLRCNIGNLNILVNENYTLNQDESVTPNIDFNSYGVFAAMYRVRYYDKQLRAGLGAAGYTPILETASDGMKIRFQAITDISKVWLESKMQAQKELDDLINAYKVDKVMPNQVAGDDTQGVSLYTVTTNGLYSRQVQI